MRQSACNGHSLLRRSPVRQEACEDDLQFDIRIGGYDAMPPWPYLFVFSQPRLRDEH